jgi:hypothetical protein
MLLQGIRVETRDQRKRLRSLAIQQVHKILVYSDSAILECNTDMKGRIHYQFLRIYLFCPPYDYSTKSARASIL